MSGEWTAKRMDRTNSTHAHQCRRHRAGLGGLLCALWLWAAPAMAQSECGIVLEEALKVYEGGSFNKVVSLLTPCVESGNATRSEKVESYRLLAMTYIASDHLGKAAEVTRGLLAVKPDYETTLRDPPQFARMVEIAKLEGANIQVTSVSKNSENLLKAPATVLLISREEILRRGYQDLEALIHDLPGFDISRGNGVFYANVYQRGYRANGTDRTLFLFDGVEENDLWSNFANISRQYPISNIKRVEVVYGPASTMYGPNAYVGVINVITREPEEMIARGRKLGVNVQSGQGAWNTRYADITVAGREENISFSLTGRLFRSDEGDLSSYGDWDYQPHEAAFYQEKLAIRGVGDDGNFRAETFLQGNPTAADHPYVAVVRQEDGQVTALEITDLGGQVATDFDRAALGLEVNGSPAEFSNHTDDWLIYGKLRLGDLRLGVQSWRRAEGSIGWFPDDREGSSEMGGVWIPRHTFFYINYDKNISESISLSFFNRFKSHSLDDENKIVIHRSYAGEGRWDLEKLLADTPSRWSNLYFHRLSKELRSEFKLLYAPSVSFNLVSGFEFRNSQIAGEYTVSVQPHPTENGFPFDELNDYNQRDIGFYAQATYRPRTDLSLNLGGRFDNNRVRETLGYGTVFNPRAAVVYSPGNFILKAIYSEAFKAASNSAKFSTSTSRLLTNPDLEPEKVKNVDLSVGWQIREEAYIDLVGYTAEYSDVIGAVSVVMEDGNLTTQNAPIGALRIRGLQASASLKRDPYAINVNYTYTDPQNVEAKAGDENLAKAGEEPAERRIGDIASHRFNLIGNYLCGERLNLNLRINYVGERKTGASTTVPDNPYEVIDGYTAINGAVTYAVPVEGLSLQLSVNNLLDVEYFHPGVRSAEGTIHVARLPQNGRNATMRILYDF